MADRWWVNDDADNDWNNSNNWSATEGGAGGAGIPTASDIAKFSSTDNANCTLSANGVCDDLYMDSAQTSGAGDWTGTLDLNDFDLTTSGDLIDTASATITAGAGTLTVLGTTLTLNGTFTAETSSVAVGDGSIGSKTINGTVTLYNLILNVNSSWNVTVTNTLTVSNDFTITSLFKLATGTVDVKGNIVCDVDAKGSGTIQWSGSGSKSISTSGTCGLPDLVINGTGTLTLSADININSDLTYTAGTLDAGTSTVNIVNATGAAVLTGTFSLYNMTINKSAFGVTVANTVTVTNDLTITSVGPLATGTISVEGNIISNNTVGIASSGTVEWSGSGSKTLTTSGTGEFPSFTMNGSGTLTATGSFEVGNNWTHTSGTFAGTSTITFNNGTFININGGANFYNMAIAKSSFNVTLGANVTVANDFTLTSVGSLTGNTITVGGNIQLDDTAVAGTTAITWDGSGSSTLTATGGTGEMPDGTFTINGSGTLTLATDFALDATGQDLVVQAGTLACSTYNLTVDDTITVSGGILDQTSGNVTCDSWAVSSGTVNMGTGTWTINMVGTATRLNITGGTVNAETSSLRFLSSSVGTCTLVPSTVAWNDVEWNASVGAPHWTISGTMDINGDMTWTTMDTINSGDITLAGDFTTSSTSSHGTTRITLDGSTDQLIQVDGAGGTGGLPQITIASTGGTVTFKDNLQVRSSETNQDAWEYVSGTVDMTTSNIQFVFAADLTPRIDSGSMTFYDVTINNGVTTTHTTIVGTMKISNDLTITKADQILGGTIELGRNLSITNTSAASFTSNIDFNGVQAQTISHTGGDAQAIPDGTWTISNTTAIVSLLTAITVPTGDMVVDSGAVFCTADFDVSFGGTLTNNGSFQNFADDTITFTGGESGNARTEVTACVGQVVMSKNGYCKISQLITPASGMVVGCNNIPQMGIRGSGW